MMTRQSVLKFYLHSLLAEFAGGGVCQLIVWSLSPFDNSCTAQLKGLSASPVVIKLWSLKGTCQKGAARAEVRQGNLMQFRISHLGVEMGNIDGRILLHGWSRERL
jgi:hypothetical protein